MFLGGSCLGGSSLVVALAVVRGMTSITSCRVCLGNRAVSVHVEVRFRIDFELVHAYRRRTALDVVVVVVRAFNPGNNTGVLGKQQKQRVRSCQSRDHAPQREMARRHACVCGMQNRRLVKGHISHHFGVENESCEPGQKRRKHTHRNGGFADEKNRIGRCLDDRRGALKVQSRSPWRSEGRRRHKR